MTSTVQPQPRLSNQTILICGLVSLTLHAGLLAGLNLLKRSEPIDKSVQLVNIKLVPIPNATKAPEEPSATKSEPTPQPPPPMRTSPRSFSSNPMASSVPPPLSKPRPIRSRATLALTTPNPTIETEKPQKKRILKDTLASDSLFAQSATKLVKHTTVANRIPSSTTNEPKITIPTKRALNHPTIQTIHAAPSSSKSRMATKRQFTPQLPATQGAGLVKIGVRHSVPPVYPRVAKEEGWEGIVHLRILVRTDGTPGNVSIHKSSGHKVLDNAAMKAIRQWRFSPAMDGNFPVEKYLQIPLKFGLH